MCTYSTYIEKEGARKGEEREFLPPWIMIYLTI